MVAHDRVFQEEARLRRTSVGAALDDARVAAASRFDGLTALSWCKRFGTGRVFYTALGHREDLWDKEFARRSNSPEITGQFNQHLLGGILWALGLAPGDATPQAMKP